MNDLKWLQDFENDYSVNSKSDIKNSGVYFIKKLKSIEACYIDESCHRLIIVSRIRQSKFDIMDDKSKADIIRSMIHNLKQFNNNAMMVTTLNIPLC